MLMGSQSTFDILGDHLVSRVGLRKRSRAARESSLSFFDEITPQQMTAYRPDQIATILKQRDNVSQGHLISSCILTTSRSTQSSLPKKPAGSCY